MPSLSDVANQINATLTQININTQNSAQTELAIKGDTADIKARLDAIKNSIDNNTSVLANGLFAILEQLRLSNVLLQDNVNQNQTLICLAETTDDLLCRILHEVQKDSVIQTTIRDAVTDMDEVLDLVHASQALEVERQRRLQAEIDACCPPVVPPPEKCFDPCAEPNVQNYTPRGQDWTPPAQPQPPVLQRGIK
jgi:hypothetical protein